MVAGRELRRNCTRQLCARLRHEPVVGQLQDPAHVHVGEVYQAYGRHGFIERAGQPFTCQPNRLARRRRNDARDVPWCLPIVANDDCTDLRDQARVEDAAREGAGESGHTSTGFVSRVRRNDWDARCQRLDSRFVRFHVGLAYLGPQILDRLAVPAERFEQKAVEGTKRRVGHR